MIGDKKQSKQAGEDLDLSRRILRNVGGGGVDPEHRLPSTLLLQTRFREFDSHTPALTLIFSFQTYFLR